MASKNSNFFDELNQLGKDQQKIIDSIERLKQDADADQLEILESVEKDAYATVIDIDNAKKKIDSEKTNLIEMRDFLRKGIRAHAINAKIERDPNFGIPV